MPRRPNIAESDAPSARRAGKRPSKPGEAPVTPPEPSGHGWLRIRGARHNNLKNVTVDLPLSRFVCVTGVSGSGKSSLINDILGPVLGRQLNGELPSEVGAHDGIDGVEQLDKAIVIDQSPIGRTPRSNPATYIKLFDEIRRLYHQLPDSQVRGYQPGRFSFNVPTDSGGGRCEACEGNGATRIEMDFLADVWVTCPVCNGHRFNFETLQVHFKGKSIFDVLDMDVQQALTHFDAIPKVRNMLQTLHDVGLDYLKLGQSSTTLSGGEAQRIKLARELVRQSTGRTLYLLDEPTTGLHFEDIRRLLAVLHGFVDVGNTVVCIEHNLDVIKTADWVIDMGPEGGAGGGRVVAVGTPEAIARAEASHTGVALREVLPANGELLITNGEKNKKKTERSSSKNNSQFAISHSQLKDSIVVVGAREHNLKDLTVNIPRGAMTVCSGVSGSGKTSFAIDTVYTEGQRRYVESLSSYARQFLGQLAKPKVDHVYGLSPAIAIEQKTASKSPRSTVGTITEIYDYMRVLWARVGQPYCPKCDIPIGTQTSDEIVAKLMALPEGSRVVLAAPIERGAAESWDAVLIRCKAGGYARVRIDGVVHELGDDLTIDARRQHAVELVIDRVVIKAASRGRIAESIEHCLAVGKGVMSAIVAGGDESTASAEQTIRFSQHLACAKCESSYESLTPHHFSFNARLGWCPACEGLGMQRGTSPDTVLVRPHLSILSGAVAGWEHARNEPMLRAMLTALAGAIGFDANAPVSSLSHSHRRALLFGLGERWIAADTNKAPGMRFQWKGFFPAIDEAVKMSWQYRGRLENLVADVDCQTCGGGRIRSDAAAVRVQDKTLVDVCALPLDATLAFFRSLKFDARNRKIAADLLREITSRLEFLNEVGLEYLTLNRAAPTLSGGEAQRIRLASQIGSGLTGVLYVLDEPTIGLHPRDNQRLIAALHRLRDLGNTLLMVEHDREVIAASDHVIDFGPGAGSFGGHIVGADAPAKLKRHAESLTGKYLSGDAAIAVPTNRRPVPWGDAEPDKKADPPALIIRDARQHNLKGIDVSIPLGRFVCVTGVSGSGKSSLITDILRPALEVRIHRARATIGLHDRIDGVDHVDKIISVDQQPIGNSPLSNPATYTGIFDLVREHFARLPDSKVRGFTANRFSFNRPGGRCEACEGQGQVCHEMHFLPDVWTTCETCNGARYNAETLTALFKGKSIADVLNMSADEAIELFAATPKIRRLLQTLIDVGLGYLPLGQSANTLSGGEAQRVKLAAELARPNTGRTLYVLDEPTTGLHFDDLRKLLDVLHRLVDLGNTVVCIEHNLDVIKTADWIIDMGPEAGEGGGTVVAAGTPEAVANGELLIANGEKKGKKKTAKSGSKSNSQFAIRHSPLASHTGRILADVLTAGPHAERPRFDPKAAAAAALREEKAKAATVADETHVKMPWERDGKRWHTTDRVSREGHKIEWEGRALSFIVETIEKLGGDALLPTDWNDRSRVEIKAKAPEGVAQGDVTWFCHILTGAQWLLDVSLRAPRGSFSESALQKKLGLKPLDKRDDIHAYGSFERVRIRRANADYDQIRIQIHDFAEINTAAFKAFLSNAVSVFVKHVAKLGGGTGKAAPWKSDGKAWHLSQKGIHHDHVRQWKPTTLLELLGRMSKCLPGLAVDWSKKIGLALSDAGGGRVGTILTNQGSGLIVQLGVPPGRFTPTQLERLGVEPELESRGEEAFVTFAVQSIDQVDTSTLATVLKASAESHAD